MSTQRQQQEAQVSTATGAPSASTSVHAAQPATIKVDAPSEDHVKDPKAGKRRFFGLGSKRKEEDTSKVGTMAAPPPPPPPTPAQSALSSAPLSTETSGSRPRPLSPSALAAELRPVNPVSPTRNPYPSAMAMASPSPSRMRSGSPRVHSPASSEIFERSVQEPVGIAVLQSDVGTGTDQAQAHIPAHVITEDHIPPALEASAQAITSGDLNPDDVEIVTSVAHQPAAASVLDPTSSHADLASLISPLQRLRAEDSYSAIGETASGAGVDDETASNYGSLDPTDVRRLSFISFADVVQSEHLPPTSAGLHVGDLAPGSRDSLHIASLPSSLRETAATAEVRASSPLRSPRSPTSGHIPLSPHAEGVITPPLINSPTYVHADSSPVRAPSTLSGLATQHGELTIETMTQAVRKTASGDLRAASAAMSPVSTLEEGVSERDGNNS